VLPPGRAAPTARRALPIVSRLAQEIRKRPGRAEKHRIHRPPTHEIAAQIAVDPIPISTWRQCATCAGNAVRFVSIFAAADSTGIPERLRGANQSVYSTTKPWTPPVRMKLLGLPLRVWQVTEEVGCFVGFLSESNFGG